MERLISIIVCFLLAVPSTAEIITVDDDGIADFNSIQSAIDSASDGDTIIVQPGLYQENINFLGKNIVLTSTNPANPNVVKETIMGFDNGNEVIVMFRGTEEPNCTLTGFNINGSISGFDWSIDPSGENHTHATISYCVFQGNCTGVIKACDGTINHCVIADNNNPHCLYTDPLPAISECRGLIKNCTIVNNYSYAVGLVWYPGAVTIENCIIYNNGNFYDEPQIVVAPGATLNISYCNIQDDLDGILGDGAVNWGPGNIDTDPCFVREGYWDFNEPWTFFEGDYHLQSVAGRWDPNSESWVTDANTSICIDAGNPGCPPDSEPLPNGSRINMGAYGGTPTASKSPADWRSIADLTNDWAVDFNDLAVFVGYWLNIGLCIPSDLNHNGSVDFNDFAIFSQQWPDTYSVGPGVTYQIDDCVPETERGLDVLNQLDLLRFSVTVEDSFIHFKDMMAANCCPDELGLEMTVVDSIITIYETEYTPAGCWCICDYPVAATLGPFEPGVYILEVYEDWGGFIGSTIVIIE